MLILGINAYQDPQGVRGRNSDNSRLRKVLGWEPQISLEEGLACTYAWIEEKVRWQYMAQRMTW
jgi:GDP-D-mannose 3', 5'-epimerase